MAFWWSLPENIDHVSHYLPLYISKQVGQSQWASSHMSPKASSRTQTLGLYQAFKITPNSSLILWRWSDHGSENICPIKLSKVNWNSNSKIDSVKFEWRRTHYVQPKINFDFKYQNSLTSTKNHEKCYGGRRKRTSWLIYPRSFISIGVFLPEKWRFATFF